MGWGSSADRRKRGSHGENVGHFAKKPPKAGGNFWGFCDSKSYPGRCKSASNGHGFRFFSRLRRCLALWEQTLSPLNPQLTVPLTEFGTLFSVATTGTQLGHRKMSTTNCSTYYFILLLNSRPRSTSVLVQGTTNPTVMRADFYVSDFPAVLAPVLGIHNFTRPRMIL